MRLGKSSPQKTPEKKVSDTVQKYVREQKYQKRKCKTGSYDCTSKVSETFPTAGTDRTEKSKSCRSEEIPL